jgi:hypothetical protein
MATTMVHRVQRVALGAFALWAGAPSVAALIVPQLLARTAAGKVVPGGVAVAMVIELAAMRLGLALVALVAARAPKPPRSLCAAVAIGALVGVAALLVAGKLATVPMADVYAMWLWLVVDGALGLTLAATALIRRLRRNG